MEAVKETIIFIENHSLLLVLAALAIVFGVKWMNLHFKKKEFEFDALKKKQETENHEKLMEKRNQVSLVINKLIERVMYKTNACRAYVFEFHNGITPLGGLPFSKMTNTYEYLNEGAISQIKSRENMSMQLYSMFIDKIYKLDYVVIDTNNPTDEYSQIDYATIAERGINKTIRVKITDINQKVIGFFGIDYCTNSKSEAPSDNKINKTIIPIVQEAAVELGALLSVDNNKDAKEEN